MVSTIKFTAACTANRLSRTPRKSFKFSAFSPSDLASAGLSCTSRNTPSTPAATAARASRRNELRLPSRDAIRPRRNLHRVRAIKDDGRQPPHNRQRAHIYDKIVVAERRTPLRKKHPRIPRRGHLLDGMIHVPWSHKLPLFDIDGSPRLGRRHQQIRLAAEKRRNLQHVYAFGGYGTVPRLVDISKHRQSGRLTEPTAGSPSPPSILVRESSSPKCDSPCHTTT